MPGTRDQSIIEKSRSLHAVHVKVSANGDRVSTQHTVTTKLDCQLKNYAYGIAAMGLILRSN